MPLSIEPSLALAVSIQSGPGIYAVLIGSGVSRSAGILTGWDITLDLARRVATAVGQDAGADPAGWFEQRFDEPASYSVLLSELAKSPAERSRLLRAFFEPNQEEREQGIKVPTPAHRALARLARDGYIRIILTTNFDPLAELALDEVRVPHTVISTPAAAAGAMPLSHGGCFVIKLHGDYRDPRILNTEEELARYDARMRRLLDRVLDEFGLLVVGWSATWDLGLRDRIEAAPTRRFTTYWASRGEMTDESARLVALRKAEVIQISDADTFLTHLADRVEALADVSASHPITVAAAVALAKRYLTEDSFRIRLSDLIRRETSAVWGLIHGGTLRIRAGGVNEQVAPLVRNAADAMSVLAPVLAVSAHYGTSAHDEVLRTAVERLANPGDEYSYLNPGLDLAFVPSLIALYSAGIGAVAAGRYGCVSKLLVGAQIREYDRQVPVARRVQPSAVLAPDLAQMLGVPYGGGMSLWLEQALRPALLDLFPAEDDYLRAFDRFEYLLALNYADLSAADGDPFAPVGRYAARPRNRAAIDNEIDRSPLDWAPLTAGLFGGDPRRLYRARQMVSKALGIAPPPRPLCMAEARAATARQWANAHRQFLEIVFLRFAAEADWPRLDLLQRELDRQEQDIDVRGIAWTLPAELGIYETTTSRVSLKVRALAAVPAAQAILEVFLQVVKLTVERYLEDGTDRARLTWQNVQERLQLDRFAWRKVALILQNEYTIILAGGTGDLSGDSWEWDISPAIRDLRGIDSIDSYLDVQARLLWSPPS